MYVPGSGAGSTHLRLSGRATVCRFPCSWACTLNAARTANIRIAMTVWRRPCMVTPPVHDVELRSGRIAEQAACPSTARENFNEFVARGSKLSLRGRKTAMDLPLISAGWPRKLSWQAGTEGVTMPDGAWRPCTCSGGVRHVSLPPRRSFTMGSCRELSSRPARSPCTPPTDGDHPNWTSAMAQRLPGSTRMTMPTTPVIGVDVGASTMSAGLVCPDGNVLATAQLPTQGEGRAVDTLLALIDRALASADERWSDVAGIGVGLPGLVDVENGFVRSVPGSWLPELSTVPLVALIQERSGYPVFIDNDVNALALGEWMFGPDRGVSSLVTLAIGTGMGGGLILDGQLVRGHLHSAGEIGHLAVSFNGPICACGRSGCLSTYLAGGMMAERARERLDHYPGSIVLTRAGNDPNRIGSALLFEAAA